MHTREIKQYNDAASEVGKQNKVEKKSETSEQRCTPKVGQPAS